MFWPPGGGGVCSFCELLQGGRRTEKRQRRNPCTSFQISARTLRSIVTPCTNSDRNQEFANKLLVATRIGAGRDNAEGSPKVTK